MIGIGLVALLIASMAIYGFKLPPPKRPLGTQLLLDESSSPLARSYYAGGDGIPVVLVGGLHRDVSDFNGLSRRLQDKGFQTLALDLRTVSEADDATLDGYASGLSAIFAEVLPEDAPYCVIATEFGTDIIRQAVPDLEQRPAALAMISLDGDHHLQSTDTGPPRHPRQTRDRSSEVHSHFAAPETRPRHWDRAIMRHAARDIETALKASERRPWTGDITMPVLVIHGAEDRRSSLADVLASLDRQFIEVDAVKEVEQGARALLFEQGPTVEQAVLNFIVETCLDLTR